MTESTSNPPTVDVGECAGDFPLWAAKEALKAAETALLETDKTREILAKTATSLIGWTLPLSVVFGGIVFAQTLTLPQRAAGMVGFLFTAAAALESFEALKVRDWANCGLSPSQWLTLIETPPPGASALYITVERLKSLDNALHKNDQYIELCAKRVHYAWAFLSSMPMAAFAAGATVATIL